MITIEEYREAEERIRKAREEIATLENILMKTDKERLELTQSIYQRAIDKVYGEGELKVLSINMNKSCEVKGYKTRYSLTIECEELRSVEQRRGCIINFRHQHNHE